MKESKTYCLKDYKNNHRLESIGVFARANDGEIMEVFRCYQCRKVILERREEITYTN